MIEQIKFTKDLATKLNDLCIIIYGGRYNDNMKSYGPKFLYKDIYGHPLIEDQIHNLSHIFPKAEIIIVGGFGIDKLIKFKSNSVRLVENQLFEKTNEIEDIRLGLNNTGRQNIITISADLYFNKFNFNTLLQHSCLVHDSKGQIADNEVGITRIKDYIVRLDFDLSTKWCNICYFDPITMKHLSKFVTRENNKLFLFEVLNLMIDNNIQLKSVELPNLKVVRINDPKKLKEFKNASFNR